METRETEDYNKKKVQQQYAAIEKRGQIKDKYPQHLHVEIFFHSFQNECDTYSLWQHPRLLGLTLALDFNELCKNKKKTMRRYWTSLHCHFFAPFSLKCAYGEKKKQIKIITSQPHYKLLYIFLGRMSFICAAAVLPLLPVALTFSLSMHSMKYYHINAIQNWKNYVINNAANEI